MEARELRVGNLVKLNNPTYHPDKINKVYYIERINVDDVALIDYYNMPCVILNQYLKYIEGIPLTESLLRFGFRYNPISNEFHGYNMILYKRNNYLTWGNTKIYYIHQLQNLYFALTGNELTLNE